MNPTLRRLRSSVMSRNPRCQRVAENANVMKERMKGHGEKACTRVEIDFRFNFRSAVMRRTVPANLFIRLSLSGYSCFSAASPAAIFAIARAQLGESPRGSTKRYVRLAAARVQSRVGDFFSRNASVSQNRASCRLNGGNWRDDGHVAKPLRFLPLHPRRRVFRDGSFPVTFESHASIRCSTRFRLTRLFERARQRRLKVQTT